MDPNIEPGGGHADCVQIRRQNPQSVEDTAIRPRLHLMRRLSVAGTFETCLPILRMSVHRGRQEVAVVRPNRRTQTGPRGEASSRGSLDRCCPAFVPFPNFARHAGYLGRLTDRAESFRPLVLLSLKDGTNQPSPNEVWLPFKKKPAMDTEKKRNTEMGKATRGKETDHRSDD
jgi:hypothetical protein